MVFDKDWFIQHQGKLLWLSNTSIGRYLLRIYNDCPKGRRIVQILPNSYSWDNEDGTVTVDIRSHNKFAKRLYHGLKPLWYTLHFWDWLIADRFYPELSFQFLTLTAFPSAGEVSPCDGYVARIVTGSYVSVRDGAGTTINATATSNVVYMLSGGVSGDSFRSLFRGVFMFDTSSIGDNDTINSAIFSLYGTNKVNDLALNDTNAGLAVCAVTTASTSSLVASDYNISNWVATVYANYVAYSALSTTAYNDMNLNAVGLSNINKTGVTKIGARMVIDIDNGAPSSTGDTLYTRFDAFYADQTGTANDPKLVVTYTAVSLFFQTVSGALAFTGVTGSQGFKTNTGTTSFSGIITKNLPPKTLLGSVSAVGDILSFKGVTLSLTGAISATGETLKQGLKSLTGAISSSGAILMQSFKSLIGSITSTGAMAAQKVTAQVLSGAISFTGDTFKTVGKLIIGALSLTGSLGMATAKLLSGVISLTGGVIKGVGRTLAGVLSFIGNILSGDSDIITVVGSYQMYFSIAPNVSALLTKDKKIDVLLTKNKNIDVLVTKNKNIEVKF